MCMEDVEIGRMSLGAELNLTLDAATPIAIPGDPTRTCLVFSPPSTGFAIWTTKPVHDGTGLIILSTVDPVVLDLRSVGNLVTKQWLGLSSAGNPTQTVLATATHRGRVD